MRAYIVLYAYKIITSLNLHLSLIYFINFYTTLIILTI